MPTERDIKWRGNLNTFWGFIWLQEDNSSLEIVFKILLQILIVNQEIWLRLCFWHICKSLWCCSPHVIYAPCRGSTILEEQACVKVTSCVAWVHCILVFPFAVPLFWKHLLLFPLSNRKEILSYNHCNVRDMAHFIKKHIRPFSMHYVIVTVNHSEDRMYIIHCIIL